MRGRTGARRGAAGWRAGPIAAILLLAAPAAQAQAPPANAAGLAVSVTPDTAAVGTGFAFRVTSRQAGYLVLLDVNAEGSVTQLYPNLFSMHLAGRAMPAGQDPCTQPAANTLSSSGLQAGGDVEANRIDPGAAFELPGAREGTGYAFQACPPRGRGMVVAVLSDKPVQIIDLPDIPAAAVGQKTGFDRLVAALQGLRLVSGDDAGRATVPVWSVSWAPYVIR